MVQPKAVDAVAKVENDPAERDFQQGQRLFLQERYQAALPYFRRSFAQRPSPNSQLYIARCMVELGHLLEGLEEYKNLIVLVSEQDDPAHYAETQKAATTERAELRKRLAWVRVTIPHRPSDLMLNVAGKRIAPSALGQLIYVLPGAVDVFASAPGYPRFSQRLHLTKGQMAEVAIVWAPPLATPAVEPEKPPPAPEPSNPYHSWALVGVGVGVVGLGTWAGFGLRAQDRCERVGCPLDEVDTSNTETAISQVGLGVGIAGMLSAGALWWMGSSSAKQQASLQFGVGADRLQLNGSF